MRFMSNALKLALASASLLQMAVAENAGESECPTL